MLKPPHLPVNTLCTPSTPSAHPNLVLAQVKRLEQLTPDSLRQLRKLVRRVDSEIVPTAISWRKILQTGSVFVHSSPVLVHSVPFSGALCPFFVFSTSVGENERRTREEWEPHPDRTALVAVVADDDGDAVVLA